MNAKKKNKYTKHGDVTQILGRKSIILELSREDCELICV